MSEIVIKVVLNKKDRKAFVMFPFHLYAGNPYWVPPIIADELDDLNPKKNPAFEYAESRQWLAYEDNKVVGRIAGIKHNFEFEDERLIRFGWIDFVDNEEVSSKLIEAVEHWANEQGAVAIHGPMGFNDFDFEGMLVEGFDSIATIATIYNHPYYKNHLDKLGFEKSVDWLEFEYAFGEQYKIPERLQKLSRYVSKKYGFNLVDLKKKKDLLNFFDKFFFAVNESYKLLYGYYKLTEAEGLRLKNKFFKFLSLKYLSGVVNEHGDIVAFAITMPSLSKAFKKANGRLFPFGFIHILWAIRTCKEVDLYLIGALPEYQEKGVSSMVFLDISEKFINEGVKTLRFNPTLEDHGKLLGNWGSIFGDSFLKHDNIKRRRCFKKVL